MFLIFWFCSIHLFILYVDAYALMGSWRLLSSNLAGPDTPQATLPEIAGSVSFLCSEIDRGTDGRYSIVPKLPDKQRISSTQNPPVKAGQYSPKRCLDTPYIVLPPIPPRDLFLTHRHPHPAHPHHSNSIRIILIKDDFQPRIVSLDPLSQSPFLHDFLGGV